MSLSRKESMNFSGPLKPRTAARDRIVGFAWFCFLLGSCVDAAFLHRKSSTLEVYPWRISHPSNGRSAHVQRTAVMPNLVSPGRPMQWSLSSERNENTAVSMVGIDGSSTASATIVSPVLKQVYPALLQHVAEYGHPNIPLGSSEGRQCATLRRLRSQEKLAASDIDILDRLGFYFHSLEDVYQQQKDDFDDLFHRLQMYVTEHDGDVSPPKKYAADPELGAWVTALRRLYAIPDGVEPAHVERLNTIGFQWVSPRQCGSKFMQMYRQIQERLADAEPTVSAEPPTNESGESIHPSHPVWDDPTVIGWVHAQQDQVEQLSETRKHYLEQLVGPNWLEWKPRMVDQ